MENVNQYPNGMDNHKANDAGPQKDNRGSLNQIESDEDTLEPQQLGPDWGIINADDPTALAHWANALQVSSGGLKATIILAGDKISDVRKYLNV